MSNFTILISSCRVRKYVRTSSPLLGGMWDLIWIGLVSPVSLCCWLAAAAVDVHDDILLPIRTRNYLKFHLLCI